MKTQMPAITIHLRPDTDAGTVGALTAFLMSREEVVRVETPKRAMATAESVKERLMGV